MVKQELLEKVGHGLQVQHKGFSQAFPCARISHIQQDRDLALLLDVEVASLNCLLSPGKVPHLLQAQIQDWIQDSDRAVLEVLPRLHGRRMPRQPDGPAWPSAPASQP